MKNWPAEVHARTSNSPRANRRSFGLAEMQVQRAAELLGLDLSKPDQRDKVIAALANDASAIDLIARNIAAYQAEFESSGGNDNISIEMGIVLAAVGTLWATIRLRSRLSLRDLVVHGLLVVVQAVYLAALEMGSIATTVLRARNVTLAVWVVAYCALCAWLAVLAFRMLRHRRDGANLVHGD